MRYRAFFSYARADEKIANWLHRRVDGYRTPRALVGSAGAFGRVPPKLHPIFRDRTDLQAGGQINHSLQRALEESETLVVLCTPASAQSHWVDRECATFIGLGREDRIFPVIAEGGAENGKLEEEFYPPSLRGKGLLAADLREIKHPDGQLIGDGREGGLFKLLAGLLGLPLDQLIQRERRRQRQLIIGSGIASVTFAGIAAAAGGFWLLADRRAETISTQSRAIEAKNKQVELQRDRAVTSERAAKAAQSLAEKNAAEREEQRLRAEAQTQVAVRERDEATLAEAQTMLEAARNSASVSDWDSVQRLVDKVLSNPTIRKNSFERAAARGLSIESAAYNRRTGAYTVLLPKDFPDSPKMHFDATGQHLVLMGGKLFEAHDELRVAVLDAASGELLKNLSVNIPAILGKPGWDLMSWDIDPVAQAVVLDVHHSDFHFVMGKMKTESSEGREVCISLLDTFAISDCSSRETGNLQQLSGFRNYHVRSRVKKTEVVDEGDLATSFDLGNNITFSPHGGMPIGGRAFFSPNKKLAVLSGSANGVSVWNTEDQSVVFKLSSAASGGDDITVAAFDDASQLLALSRPGNAIQLYSYSGGPPLATMHATGKAITDLAIDHRGKAVLSLSSDGIVNRWSLAAMSVDVPVHLPSDGVFVLDAGTAPGDLALGTRSGEVQLFLGGRVVSKTFDQPVSAIDLVGHSIAVGFADGSAAFGNLDGGLSFTRRLHKERISVVAASQDLKLMLSGGPDRMVRVTALDGLRPLCELKHDSRITNLAFAGLRDPSIATGTSSGSVAIWNLSTCARTAEFNLTNAARLTALDIDQTSGTLIAGAQDGQVFFQSLLLHNMPTHSAVLPSAILDTQIVAGDMAAVAAADGIIYLLWLPDLRIVGTIIFSSFGANSAKFYDGGRGLVYAAGSSLSFAPLRLKPIN